MNILDFIKDKIFKRFTKVEKLDQNPNNPSLTFVANIDQVKLDEIQAGKIWYLGDGNQLLSYYTDKTIMGFNNEPIYNRNKRNYFWSLSATECNIKRVHSGVPNAIVNTICNVVGVPKINDTSGIWEKIAKENRFNEKLVQQARPLTMAEGYGAWKVNFNLDVSDYPTIEFYEAENVEYIYKCGILIGICFIQYYKDDRNRNYVLIESRYKDKGNSYIEFKLCRLEKNNEVVEVPFTDLPELADKDLTSKVIENYNKITAVPSRYYYDPINVKYGRSIFAGKFDLFDDLDLALSQKSQTMKVSTPVEYYAPDVLDRSKNGSIGAPSCFNRQFIEKAGIPDGDGNVNQDIITTQPQLNFEQYDIAIQNTLAEIYTGIISPATLGNDLAKRDNADAQREKEKQTIFTRNNIIASETNSNEELVNLALDLYSYMHTTEIPLIGRDIEVSYDEFANPSREQMYNTLTSVLTSGGISPELYVDEVYGTNLSVEKKAHEIEWIKQRISANDMDMGEALNDTMEQTRPNEVEVPEGQENILNDNL